jgi:LytS/YehU family sensor histidine kinase
MKANQTPEMILKLSSLLDYLLYKVDKPFVHLTEDVDHIKDYIELEKMRFNDTLSINFEPNITSAELKISPMLLITFVENSFKHGAIKSGKLNIDIKLYCEEQTLYFSIENTKIESKNLTKGIGLENIKKRLELLYKNNYTLNIDNTNDTFKVDLKLNLN